MRLRRFCSVLWLRSTLLMGVTLLLGVFSVYGDDAISFESRSTLLGSRESIKVPASGGKSPSVLIFSTGGNGKLFATGAAADNIGAAMAAAEQFRAQAEKDAAAARKPLEDGDFVGVEPPTRPRLLEIRDSKGKVSGGLTELRPGSGVFITARHVLQQRNIDDLQEAFKRADLNLDRYRAYGMSVGKERLDSVILVPKGMEADFFESGFPRPDCEGTGSVPLRLKALPELEKSIVLHYPYYSYQFGTTGSDAVEQVSRGRVQRAGVDRFYLDLSQGNYTSGRSSGAIVYTSKVAKPVSAAHWKVGGIVECIIPPGKDAAGVPTPGAVRVLSSYELLSAEVRPESLGAIAAERRSSSSDCIPIDGGRDGGGK